MTIDQKLRDAETKIEQLNAMVLNLTEKLIWAEQAVDNLKSQNTSHRASLEYAALKLNAAEKEIACILKIMTKP